ncbi:TPA: hypothetical protein OTX98_000258 [Klebsiella aerogenes]|nr:hypothetical protein [Klebsiella aerogenes]
MKTHDPHQLEKLKDRLKDRMGIPVGWHMSGIPLIGAMILSMFAFALAQPYLCMAMFDLFGLPQYAVMAAIVPVSLIYSLVMVLAMYFVARGNFLALKLSLALMVFSGLVASVYFLSVCLGALFGAGLKPGFLISAVLGLLFMFGCIRCINSQTFYRANALYLHNRVWRKQLNIQRQMPRRASR